MSHVIELKGFEFTSECKLQLVAGWFIMTAPHDKENNKKEFYIVQGSFINPSKVLDRFQADS